MASESPTPPKATRAHLAQPSAAYKRHAWLAMGLLLFFVALYVFLAGWFVRTAVRLFLGAVQGGQNSVGGIVVGVCATFLAVFMLKALFFVKHGGQSSDLEITAQEEPRLFAFLNQLADEAGAPRAHRVFLSARVNAAVFYDLNIVNLIFPSRKNLEIGLGLVNVLTLDELKAVLAHEFGHFAQRSMAVGRWVYMAQQIASAIVFKRDALDNFLKGLSRFDIRIAWAGWLMSLIVWSIRSLMETVFNWVVLAQRALSREMEMQADLVAVSLTGSDALVHALLRTQAADDAWDRAASFVNGELANKRAPTDFFALQTAIIAHMRRLLNKADYGDIPPLPLRHPEQHRVFKTDLAQPASMWSTHPADFEREANAKRNYVGMPLGTASAWVLFQDAPALRERMTTHLLGETDATPVPLDESLKALEADFSHEYHNPAYRGVYLGRSIVRHAETPAELVGPSTADALKALDALYPESLVDDVERLRTLEREKAFLDAFAQGGRPLPSGGLQYHGRRITKRELPHALDILKKDLDAVQARIRAHDLRCRTAHRVHAEMLGGGWAAYLAGLLEILHYADHAEANIRDAQGLLSNVYAVVTAVSSVNSEGVGRIIVAAGDLFRAVKPVFEQSKDVVLDESLRARLEIEAWDETLEAFTLVAPTRDNIGDWLKVIDGWINVATGALSKLKHAALEQLLLTEARLRNAAPGETVSPAPEPSRAPARYATLTPDKVRALQTKLGAWARFQRADGVLASIARLAAAGGIVAAVLGLGGSVGDATLTIYNGLGTAIRVDVGGQRVDLAAFSAQTLPQATGQALAITTRTADGRLIETSQMPALPPYTAEVYNVGAAAPLVAWHAVYGNVSREPETLLGATRWLATNADHIFSDPPKSIQTQGEGGSRKVLSGFGNTAPDHALNLIQREDEQAHVIAMHARWDADEAPYVMDWLHLASRQKGFPDLLAERLRDKPNEVVSRRFEQDTVTGAARDAVCQKHREQAAAQPESADWHYLAIRCLPDPAARSEAFQAGLRRWPTHGWLAYAAGHVDAEAGRWESALAKLEKARYRQPAVAVDLSLDVARLRRMVASDGHADLNDLDGISKRLDSLRAIEAGSTAPSLRAFSALGQGRLKDALALTEKETSDQAFMLRMVAASDGADPDWVARALALPPTQDAGPLGVWVAIGLAARAKQDTTPYFDTLHEQAKPDPQGLVNAFKRFVQAVQAGNVRNAEQFMTGFSPAMRGEAYCVGVIILGEKAPPAWRDNAKRLLFAGERPYFK